MWQYKLAAPISVLLFKQCRGQMRLQNGFIGQPLLAVSDLQTFAFSLQGY